MKLEVGKYYLTSDNAKRGPVEDRGDYFAASGWHYRSNGTHLYGDSLQNLVKECKGEITMDGKYAYSKDPYTQVRILCVDRSNSVYPVVTDGPDGTVRLHKADGVYDPIAGYSLVPLQEKLPDLWVILHKDGSISATDSKSETDHWLDYLWNKECKVVKYIPAPDQTS